MTFQPATVARWKRRFAGCLALAMVAMLLTGAKEMTNEWLHRPARREQATANLVALGQLIAHEMPGAADATATRLSPRHALSLIRACSREQESVHERQHAPSDMARN